MKEKIKLTDAQEESYKKLVEIIGEDALLLIHLKHSNEFIVRLEEIKQEAQKELLEELHDDTWSGSHIKYVVKKRLEELKGTIK